MNYDLKVPVRDGVEFSTDIYLPDVDGSVPIILPVIPID
tara:strand:- start:654 stop:770 length:117 start_codon:yes stop_codon:yes gene_type:complete